MSVHGNIKRKILYAMYKTLTDYNGHNNAPLSNENI